MSVPQIPQSPLNALDRRALEYVLNPERRMQDWFSGPQPGAFKIIGNLTSGYNCFAWAAGNTSRRWEPFKSDGFYWPDGVPEAETLEAYVQAYATLGYRRCDSAHVERRYEKIAIYVKDGVPSHAARQLPNGRWTSKIGDWELVEHDYCALEGNRRDEYGEIVEILRRRRKTRWSQLLAWPLRSIRRHNVDT
jgi:hypothetical protein